MKKYKISEDMKQLAIARIKTIPENYRIKTDSTKDLSRDEIIDNILNDSDIGKKMVSIQIDYLRDMAQNYLYQT